VLTIDASRLAAREEEESWRTVEHDAPDVRAALRDTGAILDIELETRESGHLLAKSRRIVLAPPSFRES
jgi:hypothetical protein